MANFNILKAAIDAVIRANGQQEITGPILNAVLKAMVDSLGAGFELAGVATPSTNPGTPDQDVYWLAYQGGTYTNFGGAVLPTGISMLKWDGSWTSQTFFTVDDQLTPNSNNLAKSGAVFDAVMQGGVFDLSAYNSGAKYADLSAALTELNSLPAAYKRGGMSIKFVSSVDNKYVQFRYMGTSTAAADFTNVANWQGVDSDSLISYDTDIATKNTVLLNNAYDVTCNSADCRIAVSTQGFSNNTDYKHAYIPVVPGEKYHVDGIANHVLRIAFATTNEVTPGGAVPVVAGTSVIEIPANTSVWITIPEGCSYLLLWRNDEIENFVGKVKKAIGVDNEPMPKSKNMVTSGGVQKANMDILKQMSKELTNLTLYDYGVLNDGTFSTSTINTHAGIKCLEGQDYIIENHGASNNIRYAFVTSLEATSGGAIPMVTGTSVGIVPANSSVKVTIPAGCSYLIFNNGSSSYSSEAYFYNGVKFGSGENLYDENIYNYLDNTDTGLITKEAVKSYTNGMLDWLFVNKTVPIVESDIVSSKCLRKDNILNDASEFFHISTYDVKESCCYSINGYRGNNDDFVFYLWLDENDNVISYNDTLPKKSSMKRELVKAPVGAVKLRVQGNSVHQNARCSEITSRQSVLNIFTPSVEYNKGLGEITFGNISIVFDNGTRKVFRTKFIRGGGTINIESGTVVAVKLKIEDTEADSYLYADETLSVDDNNSIVLLLINSSGNIRGGLLAPYYWYLESIKQSSIKVVNIDDKLFFGDMGLTAVSPTNVYNNAYLMADGSIVPYEWTKREVYEFAVDPSKKYYISGNIGSSTDQTGFAILDANGNVLFTGKPGTGAAGYYSNGIYDLPITASKILLNGSDITVPQLYEVTSVGAERAVFPEMFYGLHTRTDGSFIASDYKLQYYSTIRFLKLNTCHNIKITTGSARNFNVLYYDKDFQYLGYSDWYDTVANTELTVNTPSAYIFTAKFIKINIRIKDDSDGNAKTTIKVKGDFTEDWDVYNLRSSDSGYQRIAVQVNITNPNCCDGTNYPEGTEAVVQDSAEYKCDYGVICLPDKYSNTGKPTRLIIYCHGSAVNYSSSVTRFNAQDLEPDYWLSEGYAVMDIEGNPYNNTDVHGNIPQSFDCYIEAYRWAIKYYNLCKDGVFIGGRSLGSKTALLLSKEEYSIPVLACCPNAGINLPVATWEYSNATRRKFFADKMGFLNQPTWSSTTPMPSAEWDCLKENFDKLAKYTVWSVITDLPSKDVLLADNLNIAKSVRQSDVEEAVYETLHAKIGVPVKLFACYEDGTCYYDRSAKMFEKMFANSAQVFELRMFHSYKDYSGTGTSAHHYDTQDPALRVGTTEEPFINSYGEELTNVPIVYIEMLQFWRRYEQGN